MTLPQIFVILVLIVPMALVFMNRLREDTAALLIAVTLGLAQVAGAGILAEANTPEAASKALEGFGTPEVITLMSLFILTYCLDKYGVTRWIAGRLLALGGSSERRLMGLFAVTGAILSLFMNTLAAGALLLPGALDASRRSGIKPGKLLIPIAYGTMLGGAATYLTTANIIISGLLPLANPPQPPLNVLDFTPTGGLVALAGLLFIIVFGPYLLPNSEPASTPLQHSGSELVKTYQLRERLWEAEVMPGSPLIHRKLSETGISDTFGLTVPGIRRGRRVIPVYAEDVRLQARDVLFIVGREDRVMQLEAHGLDIDEAESAAPLEMRDTLLVEMLVPPRSPAEGKTLRDLAFSAQYGFTAVALWRDNRSYRTDVATFALRAGDSLLVIGSQKQLNLLQNQHDFVVLQTASASDRLDVRRVALTLVIAIGALLAMFAGIPVALATLSAAVALLLTGLIQPEEAYSAIKWRAIFLIAGTITLSLAMVQTGLAALIGDAIVNAAAPFGEMGLVIGTYLLSAILTQVMGGQISPLVVGPVTISAAIRLGVNPQAIAVVTAIAGSVSFITPLSHPVNILMIAPGNYKFSDFVKSGWLLTLVCFIALMIAVPLFWKL